MTYGIIGDIHDKADKANTLINLALEQCQEVILLGDYVDNFGDSLDSFVYTLRMLGEWQRTPRVTCMIGNHEASYMNTLARCSGWTSGKQYLWDLSVKDKIFNPRKLHPGKILSGTDVLVTHAGLCDTFTSSQDQIKAVTSLIKHDVYDPYELGYPYQDDGKIDHGSILTNREKYNSLNKQYRQIFGHTEVAKPVIKLDVDGSLRSCNIDTNLRYWLELRTNETNCIDFTVHSV